MAKNSKVQLVIDGKDNTKAAFRSVDKGLEGLTKSALKAGTAIAGAFAIATAGVVSRLVKDSIDAADAMTKMAQGAGVTTEALSGMAWGAGQSGVELSALAAAMGRLNKGALESITGVGTYAKIFDRLGISANNSEGALKNADQLLLELADIFEAMPNGAQKSALALELFGRSGAQMIPFLNAGSSGIAELTAQAERLGVVITDEQGAASEQFNDNLAIMGAVAKGTGNILARELLPTLNETIGLLVDLAENSDLAAQAAGQLSLSIRAVSAAGIALLAVSTAIKDQGVNAFKAIYTAMTGDFSGAASIIKKNFTDMYENAKTASRRIKRLFDDSYKEEGKARAAADREKRKAAEQEKQLEVKRVNEIKAIRDQALGHAKDRNKELLKEEKKHLSDIEKLQNKRLEAEKRYDLAIAKLGGKTSPGEAEPSYNAAQDLKIAARKARAAGDTEGAREAADAALEMLEAMAKAGQNTYGLQGFAKELKEIYTGTIDDEEDELQKSLDATRSAITRLKIYAEELKDLPVTVKVDEESFSAAREQLQELAGIAGGKGVYGAGSVKPPEVALEMDVPKTQRIFQDGLNSFTDHPKLAVQVDAETMRMSMAQESLNLPKLDVDAVLDDESVNDLNTALEQMIEKLKEIAVVPIRIESPTTEISLGKTNGYASGGHVRGAGTGTSDSILARLSDGEYVMRAAAVRQYGTNLLDNMNGLKLPKFADGGAVGRVADMDPQSTKPIGTLQFNLGGSDTFSVDVAGTSNLDDLHRAALKFGRTRS